MKYVIYLFILCILATSASATPDTISSVVVGSANNASNQDITANITASGGSGARKYVVDWQQFTGLPYNASNTRVMFDFDNTSSNNNTIYDMSTVYGNNNLSVNGADKNETGFTPDGSASYYFQGSPDYMSIPDGTAVDLSNNFTLSLWVSLNDCAENYIPFITKDSGTTFVPYELFRTDQFGRGWAFRTANGNAPAAELYSFSSVGCTNGEWYHLAVVKNDSTYRLYVNGELRSQDVDAQSIDNSGGELYLGRREDTPYGTDPSYFEGQMADFVIVDDVLSADDIFSIYSLGYVSDPYQYHALENYTTSNDQQKGFGHVPAEINLNTFNGQSYESSGGWDGFGHIRSSGINGFSPEDSEEFRFAINTTYAAWWYFNASTNMTLYAYHNPQSTDDGAIFDTIVNGSGRFLQVRLWNASSASAQFDATSPTALSQGTWHHIAVTYDGDRVYAYQDNTLVINQSHSGAVNSSSQYIVEKGQFDDSSSIVNDLNGSMDDWQWYRRYLSPDDIDVIYTTVNRTTLPSRWTAEDDVWRACVHSVDGMTVSSQVCSRPVTILADFLQVPVISSVIINTTTGSNLNTENITAYVNLTTGSNVTYSYNWTRNSVVFTDDDTVIDAANTTAGDTWQTCVTPTNQNGTGSTVCSNELTIIGIFPALRFYTS